MKGYVMGHAGFAFDPTNIGDMLISSKHEINWPECDGYGIILLTSATIRIGATVEWYQFDYGLQPNPTPAGTVYVPLANNCASTTVCGNNGIFTDAANQGSGYIKEYVPWISFGGNPIPHGTGAGFCSPVAPVIRTNVSPGVPYCYDIGVK